MKHGCAEQPPTRLFPDGHAHARHKGSVSIVLVEKRGCTVFFALLHAVVVRVLLSIMDNIFPDCELPHV
jgi:hypothetical protein